MVSANLDTLKTDSLLHLRYASLQSHYYTLYVHFSFLAPLERPPFLCFSSCKIQHPEFRAPQASDPPLVEDLPSYSENRLVPREVFVQ